MATQALAQLEPLADQVQPRWNLPTRIAFRCCFIYFTLYVVFTQMFQGLLPFVRINISNLGVLPPVKAIVFWTSAKLFGVDTAKLVFSGSGSGDKTYDYVLAFCMLILAIVGTAVWSLAARRAAQHPRLHKWFHLFLRFSLGSTMAVYGMMKLIPLQMPFPQLTRLVEPYGNFSPMGVLWYSIGASPAYESFVGSAELFGGILLFFPRTAILGAMICLADVVEVFMLNMCYDVPVKLFSFHLILMSLVLLAPEMPRLARFFLSDRELTARARPDLFASPRKNRIAFWAQVVLAIAIVSNYVYNDYQSWYRYGAGSPKSPLYGIWNIEEPTQWKRVIFDRPTGLSFQKLDDSFTTYPVALDSKSSTIAVSRANDKTWGSLKFERPTSDTLTIDGNLGTDKVHLRAKLLDRSKLLLVSRGFHWIQEYPFNR
jgi:uncharacterized membrane protein YphA (DoxX/SURF4 family)